MDQYSKFSVDVGGGKRENVSYKEEIINEAFGFESLFFRGREEGGGVCMCLCMQPWMLYIKRLFNCLIKRLYLYIYIV